MWNLEARVPLQRRVLTLTLTSVLLAQGASVEIVCRGPDQPWLFGEQTEQGTWKAENRGNDTGLTSLVVLGMLGGGSTTRTGPHRALVRSGLRGLRRDPGRVSLWNRALRTLVFLHSKTEGQSRTYQRALDELLGGKQYGDAWRTNRDRRARLTRCWLVEVLQTARARGYRVEPEKIAWARRWLRRSEQGGTGDLIEVTTRIACRLLVAEPKDSKRARADIERLLEAVGAQESGKADPEVLFHASMALFRIGGRDWKRWGKLLERHVLATQVRQGPTQGTWDPKTAGFGRRYTTALGVLVLEVYYRYSRLVL